jgi:tRNA threonylcarbamoyladenosine biosynthesis protein TsaB
VNILAIDSATEACSAALLRADGEIFGEFEIAPRQHARLLPEMMDRVLDVSALDRKAITHCAFTNGPGAFTGIRIAAAQAQGIGIALGIPLLPISTLAVLAQVAIDRCDCRNPMAALDARMQEIYWARYTRDASGLAGLIGSERLSGVGQVEIDGEADFGAGHGWLDELRERAGFTVDATLFPDARALLKLAHSSAQRGLVVDAGSARINYLRNRVAEKAKT